MSAAIQPMIELEHVSKAYQEAGRERFVLQDASASFAPGEFTVLIGRSGSGKSTLLNLVSGIDIPTSGRIRVAGQEITGMTERDRTLFRRRQIGFIFQFFNLVPTLTVLENLLLPLELNGRADAAARRHALELLAQVGLADRRDTYPDRLSGGEQQRIAVARALVHDPALVLADEPTGNLDLDTGRQVLGLLDALTRRAGKNLLMVTHSPEVVGLADRVLRIVDARLVEEPVALPHSLESAPLV
ncbi:MAG TPA: ABC transporter ATP-binding protein [Roseiflexaceae bacterium]|nr:ABC transporter ATP-binding protein [Roseiflexaceae bacterium]